MRALPLDEKIKEIEVYLLISKISKEFYVWKIQKGHHYTAYKNHIHLRFKQTKDMIQRSEQEEKFPEMYLLETLTTTEETAFKHCVAWTKYFIEHGMQSLSNSTILAYTNDLNQETRVIYDAIKHTPVEEVISDGHLLVSDYTKKPRTANREPKDEIKISVSHKQYEQIKKTAEENKLTMSRYCKNMVLDGRVIQIETPKLWEYNAEVRQAVITLRQILYAYYQNGRYFPADLENIQKAIDKITGSQDKVAEDFRKYAEAAQELLPK